MKTQRALTSCLIQDVSAPRLRGLNFGFKTNSAFPSTSPSKRPTALLFRQLAHMLQLCRSEAVPLSFIQETSIKGEATSFRLYSAEELRRFFLLLSR